MTMKNLPARTAALLLPLLLLAPGPQDQNTPARGPFVQSVTSTSAVVCLWTAREAEVTLTLLREDEEVATKKSAASARHAISLRDLKPGTEYVYRLSGGGVSHQGAFRTFPDDGSAFTFVAYGDGRSNKKRHAEVCEAIAAEKPLFVLHTGDLVHDGRVSRHWDDFFESAAPYLRIAPFFPAIGNHEKNAPEYFELFHLPGNERWYSFDAGPVHVIVLDSTGGRLRKKEQIDWLREDLDGSEAPFKIAVYHHPALSASPSKDRIRDSEKMHALLGPIFEKGGVRVTLQGHNHNYQRAEKNGVTYVTTGGGGAFVYPVGKPLPETKASKAVHHHVRFRVSAKTLKGEAVNLEGEVFDSFTIDRGK